MSPLTTLLFDVDGTLADTERDGHRPAFNAAFAEAGLDWSWDVAEYGELLAVTGGKERIRYAMERDGITLPGVADPSAHIAELHQAKTRFYTQALARGELPLRSGVQRLLQEAREAGLRLGIATTTTPANVTALLQHTLGTESLDWFEVIAAGDVVPAKKPAPDIYHYAMQAMGVTPEQCLAFEDSHNGLRSALGAGLKTLVTVNDYTRDQDFTGAALVLDQLGEPDQPFQVLSGDAGDSVWVDLPLLRRLHRP